MVDQSLQRRRILVVEDEFLLADELALELEDEGAMVLGPVPSVERALALLDREALPDGAIVDVNLGGETAFPLADLLIARGVPMIFTTGYDRTTLPHRYAHVPTCEKPMNIVRITAALRGAIQA